MKVSEKKDDGPRVTSVGRMRKGELSPGVRWSDFELAQFTGAYCRS